MAKKPWEEDWGTPAVEDGLPILGANKGVDIDSTPDDTQGLAQLLSFGDGELEYSTKKPWEEDYGPVPVPTAMDALGQGYLQGGTLGLANPLMSIVAGFQKPGGGETFGEEYGKAMEYFTGKMDEAKEAHPNLYATGDIASYIGPGLAGSVYKSVGKEVGGRLASKGLTKGLMTGLKTGAGLGVTEGIKKMAQTRSIPEGLKEGGKQGLTGFVAGPAVEAGVGQAGKLLEKMFSGIGSKLTGTQYSALKHWATGTSTGGQKMSSLTKKSIEQFPDIAQDMADMAKGGANIPEYKEAMKALSQFEGRVPIRGAAEEIFEGVSKGAVSPKKETDVKLLQKWLDNYIVKTNPEWTPSTRPTFSMAGGRPVGAVPTITGKAAETLKKAMQEDINYSRLSHDTPYYDKVLKKAAGALRNDLRGVPGAETYGAKMDIVAQKMSALKALQEYLGKKAGKLEINAERLLKNAATDPASMEIINGLDDAFGTQWGEIAQGIGLSRQLGGQSKALSATPQLLTTYRTGAMPGSMSIPGALGFAGAMGKGASVPLSTAIATGAGVSGSSPLVWAEGIKGLNALAPSINAAGTRGASELPGASKGVYDAMMRKLQENK